MQKFLEWFKGLSVLGKMVTILAILLILYFFVALQRCLTGTVLFCLTT